MKERCIAIIPARSGSKRIPRKNIREFLGQPIIKYTINAAIKSELFDEVMVSTDDANIAKLAKKLGASVPFLRSENNANDTATISDVIVEVINKYKEIGKNFDYFCCLFPAAPFVTKEHVKDCYKILIDKNFDSVYPIVKYSYPIQRSLIIDNNKVSMKWPENYSKRTQDFQESYHDSGMLYWMKVESFVKIKRIFTENSGAIILSEIESQDIDTEADWEIAEIKYSYLRSKKRL